MSIKAKIFLPILILLIIAFGAVFFIISNNLQKTILEQNADFSKNYVNNIYSQAQAIHSASEVQYDLLLNETKRRLKELVEVAVDVADGFYRLEQSGQMTRAEAQYQAKENIRGLWFGRSGYYWTDNTDYINVLLPPNTSVEGTSRKDLQDVNGKYLVRELVDGAVKNGETYVEYWFPKPGEEEASQKLGFTQLFEPWGWVIGTGEYIDNIDDTIQELENENIKILNDAIYGNIEGTAYPFIKTRENEYIAYIDQSKLGQKVKSTDKKTGEDLTMKYYKIKDGPVDYWYTKPDHPDNKFFKKTGYVKYFAERDWVIVYAQYEDDVLQSIKQVEITVLIVSILAIVFLSIILLLFLTLILKTLKNTAVRLDEMSMGSGDLTYRLEVKSKDETSRLAESFNRMMEKLQNIVIRLKESAEYGDNISIELAANTEEIASAAEQMAASGQSIQKKSAVLDDKTSEANQALISILEDMGKVSEQADTEAAAVEQSSAAIEQMIASIQNITRVSQNRAEQIRKLSGAARQGKNEMDQTVINIKDIAGSADSISEVLSVIDGISQQINLLSMNAAIEAAHAGEAGRGFAVVAEEIRKLAESTAENSAQIDESIKKIILQIQETSERSINTGNTISRIADETEESSNAMEEILSALAELSVGTKQITEALDNLSEASSGMKEYSKSVEASTTGSQKTLDEIASLSKDNNTGMVEISAGMDEVSSAISHIRELVTQNQDAMSKIADLIGNFKV